MSSCNSIEVKEDSNKERKTSLDDETEETVAMSEGGASGDDDVRQSQVPELQYSRGQLMELRSHPLANKRPVWLDSPNNEAIERRTGDRKRSETPTEEDSRRRGDSTGNTEKRRSNDPRERVKKEQDGIVLSPQRRSFNSGCFVSTTTQSSSATGRRPDSPPGKSESNPILGRDIGHRELPTVRRIGSGRIPAREGAWDFREHPLEMRESGWDDPLEHGFRTGSGSVGRSGDSERNLRERDVDLRHENRRRGFGWDFNRDRERDREGDRDRERDRERDRDSEKDRFERRMEKGRNERHDRGDDRVTDRLIRRTDRDDREKRDDRERRDDRRDERDRRDREDRYGRRRHDSREEEPEWFSAGPTSQLETIELRGFEDIPEDGLIQGRGKKNSRSKASSKGTTVGRKVSESNLPSTRTSSTPPPQDSLKKTSPDGKGEKAEKARSSGPLATSSPDTKEKKGKQIQVVPGNSQEAKGSKEQMDMAEESSSPAEKGQSVEKVNNASESGQMDFNLDDFLKIDSLPLLMQNGGQTEATAGCSRFRQWFSRNSPTHDESMKSVPEDLNNIIRDITEPAISIPSGNELDSFFAPISPAASSHHKHVQQQHMQARLSQQNAPNKLLEMLRRGSESQPIPAPGEIPSIRDLEASGKVHSVEELEARMRPMGGAVPPDREPRLADPAIASVVHHGRLTPLIPPKEEEVAAFKKLIMKQNQEPQVGSDAPNAFENAITGLHQSFLMMKQNQEPQVGGDAPNAFENAITGIRQSFLSMGSAAPSHAHHPQAPASQPMNIPEDLLMKLLQVQQQQQQHQQHLSHQSQHLHQQQQPRHQQDMLTKLMNNARMSQQPMHQSQSIHQQPSRRQGQMVQPNHLGGALSSNHSPLPPEIQSLIVNTSVNNDLLQRAEAQAILRGLHQGELTTQHLVKQLQNPAITRRHQELLLSVLKTQHMKSGDFFGQRVPSPRDIIGHSQNVVQSALIRKKLEEQRETMRKRQESHRPVSPNIGSFNNNIMCKNEIKHPVSSPSPLSFTPTSVLKKMNAEKDGEQKMGCLPGPMTLSDLQQMQQGSRQPSLQVSASQISQPNQHRTPQNWNQTKSQTQPQGRPIVKSNNNFYSGNDCFPPQSSGPSHHMQQQVQGVPAFMRGPPPPQFNTRSKMTLSTPPNMAQQPPQFNMNMMQARSSMPQSANLRGQHLQALPTGMQNQQPPNSSSTLQQMLMGTQYPQKNALSHGGSGDVAPNSNQLSRWFSPELLAQARSGPSIPAQGMLSVEDIERLQQAVHN